MTTLLLAAELTAAHPEAKLPCPVCANTVNAPNLAAHVSAVHSVSAPCVWRGRRWGFLPARLAVSEGALLLSTLLGTRQVALPCSVHIGLLVGTRPSAGMSSSSDNVLEREVKTGWYLELGKAMTIGCKTAHNMKAHWVGWEPGPKRSIPHLMVDRRVLVEIEYLLASTGSIRPRSAPTPSQ